MHSLRSLYPRPLAGALAASLLLSLAPLAAEAQPRPEVGSEDVPEALAERARRVAQTPRLAASLVGGRTLFIGVELVREKSPEGQEVRIPRYRVTHYRYADDTAIVSLVDLERNALVEEREIPHMPTRLAQSEFERARTMALANPAVRTALGRFASEVVVEPLLVRVADERDRWFGKRVVRLLFRVGPNYLRAPIVYVNLTDDRVQIGEGVG